MTGGCPQSVQVGQRVGQTSAKAARTSADYIAGRSSANFPRPSARCWVWSWPKVPVHSGNTWPKSAEVSQSEPTLVDAVETNSVRDVGARPGRNWPSSVNTCVQIQRIRSNWDQTLSKAIQVWPNFDQVQRQLGEIWPALVKVGATSVRFGQHSAQGKASFANRMQIGRRHKSGKWHVGGSWVACRRHLSGL